MNPYYQPPRYDEEAAPAPVPAPVEERRPIPARGWFVYLGGFLLLLAGACLVVSNSLNWHPAYQPQQLQSAPPATTGPAK